MPSIKSFKITLGDVNFLLDQLRHTILVVRYDANGQPIYGYRDASVPGGYQELGLFGSFDPLAVNGPDGLPLYQGARDFAGLRILHGFFNNLTGTIGTPAAWMWGSADDPFPRLTPPQYNHYVHQVLADHTALADYAASHPTAPAAQADSTTLYADPSKTVVDYTPRMITQTISSSYIDHAVGVADSAFVRTDIATDTMTETVTYSVDGHVTDTATIKEGMIRNQNTLPGDPSTSGIFTLFGQFFDHGLDFIDKGGQGSKIVIVLDPSDPLYQAPAGSDPGNTTITISRATPDNYTFLDIHGRPVSIAGADGLWNTADDLASSADLGADGVAGGGDDRPTGFQTQPAAANYTNHTSPYIDQSQSYGSDQQITNLLREWVQDPNTGEWRPGAELFDGHQIKEYTTAAFGTTTRTVPTLSELRAHMDATGRGDADSALTWDDINNFRARDAAGNLIDTNGEATAGGYVYTGQALLLDMNPHFDNAPLRLTQAHVDALNTATGANLHFYGTDLTTYPSETDSVKVGQLTDGTYVGASALATWVNFANFSITASDPAVYDAVSNLLVDSVGDHYVAGDGRANENFGLTSLHHVFHENHNVQLIEVENDILAQTDAALRQGFQLAVNGSAPTGVGVTVVDGHYEDANHNYTTASGAISWDPDKLFEITKLVNEMEYQHVAIDQYARLVTPDLPEFVTYDSNINADISLEYSQAAFRFGHSQLRETIDAIDPNGMVTKFALSGAFLNPAQFAVTGAADILRGMSQQVSNEVDEFLTPAMQQSLLGQSLDLGAINIARARDVGLPTLNETRRALHDALVAERAADPSTPHHTNLIVDALNPYTSWLDYGSQMLHPESLVNFIAAYAFDGNLDKANAIIGLENGTIAEGSPEAMDYTFEQAINFLNDSLPADDALASGANAFNDIDLWIGGLAEVHVFTGQLGSTFNAIFEDQMERLMDGDRLYYIYRLGMSGSGAPLIDTDLGHTIVTEQFKDIIERTTGVLHLNGDVMGYSDSYIELGKTFVEGQNLLAYKGEIIYNSDGVQGIANQGDIKYQLVGSSWVPILADFKTAHNYGQLVADYAAANPEAPIGIFSGAGGGTLGNGGFISKSNGDLGLVNQLYIRDVRPNLGTNDDGTDNQGFDAHEVLSGTDYRDFIQTGNGDDTAYGDMGDDVLDGQGGADHLYGGDGQDALYGGDIEDFVDGGAGDDWVYGGSSSGALDVVIGGDGNDRVYGEAGIDEMYGGAGDDYMDAGGDTDIFFGDGGNDEMYAGDGPDEARGGDGDDIISGGSGPDMLKGERGDDIMLPGIGQSAQNGDSDEALGDVGFDLVAWSDLNVALDVAADLRNQNLTAAGGGTPFNPFNALLVDDEGLVGSKFNDTLIGADAGTAADGAPTGDNWLIGGSGADTFGTQTADATGSFGSGGDDVIVGDSIRLDTLIGAYGSYIDGVDAKGNNTHGYNAYIGADADAFGLSPGLLGNTALGTEMFAKHFTDLLQTERFKDFVLGNDGGAAATTGTNADIAVFTGNKSDYTLTKIDFNSANEGAVTAFRIVDNRAGSPDGTDLLVGIEKVKFADQTVSLIIQAPVLDLHTGDVGSYDYATSYTENTAALPIAVNPGITDDGTLIVSAKAVLTNAIAGDRLTISGGLPAGISSSLTSVAGVMTLTLTGSATLAQYQTALGQIRFDSTSDNPTGADRTINVTVNDGFVDSNVAVATVHVTPLNDAPNAGNDRVVTNIALGTTFTVSDAALLANDADPDSALVISGIGSTPGLTVTHPAGGPVSITDIGGANGSFSYAASDGIALPDTAAVTVVYDADGTLTGINSTTTADILVGDGTGTNFDAGTGNDIIFAGAGNDTIRYSMGDGADIVDGGANTDTLVITHGNGASTLDIVLSGSAITGFEGGTLTNVESVTAALGNGVDTLSYAGTTTALTVDLGANTATGFTSASGVDNVVGGSAGDTFIGSGNANVLTGGGGDDAIDGAGGIDTAVFSGSNSDHAFALVAGSLVVSDLRLGNPDGTDTLTGIARVQLGGQTLNLVLGSAADNSPNGTGYHDLLIGFAGNDTFAFSTAANANGDVIQDFELGDRVDLSAIDAVQGGANNAFTLINHTGPGDTGTGLTAAGQVSYYLDATSGHYFLAGNTAGSTNPEFRIDLGTTLHTLTAGTDIVL